MKKIALLTFLLAIVLFRPAISEAVELGGSLLAIESRISSQEQDVIVVQGTFYVFTYGETVTQERVITEKISVTMLFEVSEGEGYGYYTLPLEKVRFKPLKVGEKPYVKIQVSGFWRDDSHNCKLRLYECIKNNYVHYVLAGIPPEDMPKEKINVPTIDRLIKTGRR